MVLAVLLTALAGLVVARSAVTLLVLVGVVGFTLSVWLLILGAPDVALTLLLVEILTVVVAVPVLRSRPDRQPVDARRSTALSGAVAVALGLAAGAAVWLLTGRTERSAVADYLLAEAEPATGGANVVNTVLVDFRGLDTLGEIGVLAAAAVGLLSLLGRVPARVVRWFSGPEAQVVAAGAVVVVPALLITAVVLFWRGHDLPGGGFIAGLVLGLALVVARLARWSVPLPPSTVLLAVGLGTAVGTGLLGLVAAGAFLEPIKVGVPWSADGLTTSLLFDLGVVLVVLGLAQTAVDRLESAGAASTDPVPPDQDSEAGTTRSVAP